MKNPKKGFVDHIPIMYVLVENSKLTFRASLFQMLSEAELALLRCWMTLMLLPFGTKDLIPDQRPFTAAFNRIEQLPQFRKAQSDEDPPPQMLDDMLRVPLLVLMLDDPLPNWLQGLTAHKEIGVLSPSAHVFDSLRSARGIHAGLLKGAEDLRESYRVLRELIAAGSANDRYDQNIRSTLGSLTDIDLLQKRPRLEFIPPFPLPQPWDGRPQRTCLTACRTMLWSRGFWPKATLGE